jgi:hypothetical protein
MSHATLARDCVIDCDVRAETFLPFTLRQAEKESCSINRRLSHASSQQTARLPTPQISLNGLLSFLLWK